MKNTELYATFGKFESVEELNKTAAGLLAEGDLESLKTLAIENGLSDMAEIYMGGGTEELTDPFMAAVGRLNVEIQTEEVLAYKDKIPAEPIMEYLQSACEDAGMAAAVMKKEKQFINCLKYIEKEARKIVTRKQPYLADAKVFQMAVDYYL